MSNKTDHRFRIAAALIVSVVGFELLLVNLREYEIPSNNPFVETVTSGQGWPLCLRKLETRWVSKSSQILYAGLLVDLLVAIACCAAVDFATNSLLRKISQSQDGSKRRLLQIHLLTAVLLVLGIGGLLCLNLKFSPGDNMPDVLWQSPTVEMIFKVVPADEGQIRIEQQCGWIGWPITFRRLIRLNGLDYEAIFYDSLLLDCGVALNVLLGIALISEWRIRRREVVYDFRNGRG